MNLDATGKTPGTRTPEDSNLAQLASSPTRILMAVEETPKQFYDIAASIEKLLENSKKEIADLKNQTDTNRLQYSMNLLDL